MTTSVVVVAAVSVALAAGCAPRSNRALDRAHAAFQQAAQNPEIAEKAPVALHEAEQALDRADRRWREDRDEKETNSLAYVAERRVEIARAVAEQKKAEDEARILNENRQQILLGARTGEARMARERARHLEEELRQLHAKQTERGTVITMGDVLFETGSAELKAGAMRDLQRLVVVLRDEPDRQVVIEGHTDDVGTAEHNRQLSQERADAVREALVTNGISRDRIEARGLGESYPVAPNSNQAGRQQNRRVEVIIPPPSATAGAGKQPREQPSSGD